MSLRSDLTSLNYNFISWAAVVYIAVLCICHRHCVRYWIIYKCVLCMSRSSKLLASASLAWKNCFSKWCTERYMALENVCTAKHPCKAWMLLSTQPWSRTASHCGLAESCHAWGLNGVCLITPLTMLLWQVPFWSSACLPCLPAGGCVTYLNSLCYH